MLLYRPSHIYFVSLILLFAYPQYAHAQQNQLNDSIEYYNETGQTKKARLLLDQVLKGVDEKDKARSHYLAGETEELEGYAEKAFIAYSKSKTAARQQSLLLTEASATRGMASALLSLGRYDSVMLLITESQRIDPTPKNKLLNQLLTGRYWQSQNQPDKTLTSYHQTLELARSLHDKRAQAMALAGMAGVHFSQDDDKTYTLQLFNEAAALYDSSRDAALLARNYARIANVLMNTGKMDEAEKNLKRARHIADLSGNLPVQSYVLASYAILMAESGKPKQAVAYAEESIRIKRQLGQYRQLQNDLLNMSEAYFELKDYARSRAAVNEGMATSKKLKDVVYLQYFYDRTALLDSVTGHFKNAYSSLQRSNKFRDSLYTVQRIKAVEEISKKYEAGQKEKVIAEKELVIQQQKYHQSFIIGIAAIIVLTLVIILVVIRSRHKSKLQSEKQKQDYVRLQTIVHTQEEVQQSIARDIHDGLVQVLGAAKISLQAVNIDGDKQLIHHRIREASQIMDEACNEARNISHQLLPYSLMKDGLVAALEELFARSLASYHFTKSGNRNPIREEASIHIYRIAQEVVNNIVKHAEAEQVKAEWNADEQALTLTISDDGKGFDMTSHPGVGLTNMQTRAALMGGVVSVNSQPGKGTFVKLIVTL